MQLDSSALQEALLPGHEDTRAQKAFRSVGPERAILNPLAHDGGLRFIKQGGGADKRVPCGAGNRAIQKARVRIAGNHKGTRIFSRSVKRTALNE